MDQQELKSIENFEFKLILELLLKQQDLDTSQANGLMHATMTGQLSSVQISAWLCSIRTKGETATEIAQFAKVMRQQAVQLELGDVDLIDTCGTGGDGSNLMNISTLSAIVLAAMGYKVAKHGNRSVSSSCGSADVLEYLNYNLEQNIESLKAQFEKSNFVFMFAPQFHPAMKYAGPVRKELGVRTVFNILGPLANPAKANIHLLGVFSKEVMIVLAQSLQKIGSHTALVVHSEDGLDEISPLAKTNYILVNGENITEGIIDPKPLKLEIKNLDEIQVSDKLDGLSKAKSTLSGDLKAAVETVALNVVACQYLHDLKNDKTQLGLQKYIEDNYLKVIKFILLGKALEVSKTF